MKLKNTSIGEIIVKPVGFRKIRPLMAFYQPVALEKGNKEMDKDAEKIKNKLFEGKNSMAPMFYRYVLRDFFKGRELSCFVWDTNIGFVTIINKLDINYDDLEIDAIGGENLNFDEAVIFVSKKKITLSDKYQTYKSDKLYKLSELDNQTLEKWMPGFLLFLPNAPLTVFKKDDKYYYLLRTEDKDIKTITLYYKEFSVRDELYRRGQIRSFRVLMKEDFSKEYELFRSKFEDAVKKLNNMCDILANFKGDKRRWLFNVLNKGCFVIMPVIWFPKEYDISADKVDLTFLMKKDFRKKFMRIYDDFVGKAIDSEDGFLFKAFQKVRRDIALKSKKIFLRRFSELFVNEIKETEDFEKAIVRSFFKAVGEELSVLERLVKITKPKKNVCCFFLCNNKGTCIIL